MSEIQRDMGTPIHHRRPHDDRRYHHRKPGKGMHDEGMVRSGMDSGTCAGAALDYSRGTETGT